MIDRPGRLKPRFPEDLTSYVGEKILNELIRLEPANSYLGLAGGSCGGDIIFHECCFKLGIRSEMYLPKDIIEFKSESVDYAGSEWSQRFDQLIDKIPFKILNIQESTEKEKNLWELTNFWMIEEAKKIGKNEFTLLALWNNQRGDGKGGTEDMICISNDLGQSVIVIAI